MASVPNYYYNSPWIADAGRNLAAALAPPDPEKQLAMQKERLTLQMLQEKQRLDAEDRADEHTIRTAYGRMMEPAINPVTGQVDPVQTEKNIRLDFAEALGAGADPKTGAGLLGTVSPYFQQQQALAASKADEFIKGLNVKAAIDERDDKRLFAHQDASREDSQAFTAEQNAARYKAQAEQNAARIAGHIQAAAAKQAGGGKPERAIPKTILGEIALGMDDRIRRTNRMMPAEQYFKFAERVGKRWQMNGNVEQAINEQWAESFPGSTTYEDAEHDTDTPGSFFSSGTRGTLAPTFGDVLTQLAMPEQPPEPTPAPRGTATPGKKRKPIESYGR